ncbi:MAG: Crp/Fnr family transcriptional regulator [Leptospirales bacterium]
MSGSPFKIANFQPNAFVIVEGKKEADAFYILRQGSVRLTVDTPIPGEDPNTMLGPGDFFGVVSAMSAHPHIETVQTLSPVALISVQRDQFPAMIQKSAPIAMKIIRYFSWKLRAIDKAITKLSFHSTSEENPEFMHKVGDYYHSNGETNHAAYAFQRYLQHIPNGPLATQCKSRLQEMNFPFEAPKENRQGLNRSFQDREMIFIEHEPGTELYIIQQGRVKITKIVDQNEVLLAVLKPGDIFGEMALLENKPRSASAVANGKVSTLAINKTNFEAMVQAQPALAVKLITILSERIWTSNRQLANLLIEDPIGRMYDMLLTLVYQKKVTIAPKSSHVFDISGQELAKMLSFTPEKGEGYLMTLLEDKNFRLQEGKIFCVNLVELEKVVQFYKKKAQMAKKREAGSRN